MKIFITGIDTDAGKTVVTGLIAKYLLSKNKKVITFKLIETGNDTDLSNDIKMHRRIMGQELNSFDLNGDTCPQLFKLPASPHLSAKLENSFVDIDMINKKLDNLDHKFEIVLAEPAGGLMVPLKDRYTNFDFIYESFSPVIVVTTSKLGSINHTILTINYLIQNGIEILGIIYNRIYDESEFIMNDTYEVIKNFYPTIPILNLNKVDLNNPPLINMDLLFTDFFDRI